MEENINPYKIYEEKRKSIYTIENNEYNFYCYEEIEKILKNPIFGKEITKRKKNVYYSLIDSDDPLHSKLRKVAAPFFSANYVNSFEYKINQIIDEKIKTIKEKQTVDITKEYALLIPYESISAILGAPSFYNDKIGEYASAATNVLDLDYMNKEDFLHATKEHDKATTELASFISDVIEYRKKKPDNNLISHMHRSGQLSFGEMITFCLLLYIAGFQTTSDLISNAIYHISQNNNVKNYLINNNLTNHQLEEIIRYDTSVHRVVRIAKSKNYLDINNEKIKLEKNKKVILHVASANRDEKIFQNPNVLDFNRTNSKKHLSFAAGMHLCLGLFLAKKEIKTSIEKFFQNFPEMYINSYKWKSSKTFRGLEYMHVNIK